MRQSSYQNRFSGISKLYGRDALNCFRQSHVAVVGLGGVGSWVAEGLVRSGIGQITMIDMDDICVTNTNRQIHALANVIGQPKVAVMSERLKLINPQVVVNEIDDFVSLENIEDYFTKDLDSVVDAIDSVISKSALIAHCRKIQLPLITIGGAGGKLDPVKIKVKDLSRATVDPLLSKVRNELRRNYNFPRDLKKKFHVDAVYSEEQIIYPNPDGSLSHARPSSDISNLNCANGLGATSSVTACFAFFAVARVLQKLHPVDINF